MNTSVLNVRGYKTAADLTVSPWGIPKREDAGVDRSDSRVDSDGVSFAICPLTLLTVIGCWTTNAVRVPSNTSPQALNLRSSF